MSNGRAFETRRGGRGFSRGVPIRKVLIFADENEKTIPWVQDGWTRVSWSLFSPEQFETDRTNLLIAVAPAERLTRPEVARWRRGGEQRRMLAVLPAESSREEIELALAVADDVVLSSERPDLFELRVRQLLLACESEIESCYENLIAELGRANLVGSDPNFVQTAERMAASARTDLPVLITGETGTGKELFAQAIHFLSRRRNHPFIPVDCGGIPDHLFENELFGHLRGAFTDAHTAQRGLVPAADGGTLFLDEVDSLSIAAQAKLLRFLQERQYRALGSEKWAQADVRVVAASNRDLSQQIAAKNFRQDLYFRLDVLRVQVPPLRERPRDIPLLARHFLARHQTAGAPKSFSAEAMEVLTSYSWPGNVRELLNVVQRAIVFSRGPRIEPDDIAVRPDLPRGPQKFRAAREESVENFERAYVHELLARHQGNITHAAKEAGKERRAFGRLAKKYGAAPRAVGQD